MKKSAKQCFILLTCWTLFLFTLRYFLDKSTLVTKSKLAWEASISMDRFNERRYSNHITIKPRQLEKGGNFPWKYWKMNKTFLEIGIKVANCATFFPNPSSVHYNNVHWQVLETNSSGTFYIYSAFIDARSKNPNKPEVRILVIHDRYEPKLELYCKFWYREEHNYVLSIVYEYFYIWHHTWGNSENGTYQAYMLSCFLPYQKVPVSVSLVEDNCKVPTNNINLDPVKEVNGSKGIGVCVKGLSFDKDISIRMIEWIELLKKLGVEKIFMYEFNIHPNISKVLDYYSTEGIVNVRPFSLPGPLPNQPEIQTFFLKSNIIQRRQIEVLPYNDCLYRNMYRFEMLGLFDIDEVVMSNSHNEYTWKEHIDAIKAREYTYRRMDFWLNKVYKMEEGEYPASMCYQNVYFMDEMLERHVPGGYPDIPQYLHIFQNVWRSYNFTPFGHYAKCFHNPQRIKVLHNHYPMSCLGGGCPIRSVGTREGQINHYRHDCVLMDPKKCNETYKSHSVNDTKVWNYKDPVMASVTRVGDLLNLI